MQLLVIQNGARRSVPVQDLKKGKDGNLQTLGVLIPLIREAVSFDLDLREFSLGLLGGSAPDDFGSVVRKLFDYARLNIAYADDPVDTERLQDWRTTAVIGVGDCDDKATLLASMLGSLGFVNRLVAVNYYDDLEQHGYDHLFNEVLKPDGSWEALDATPRRGRAGQEAAAPVRQVFEIWPEDDAALAGMGGLFDQLIRQGIQAGIQLGAGAIQQSRVSSSQARAVGRQFDDANAQAAAMFAQLMSLPVISVDQADAAAQIYSQLASIASQYGGVEYIARRWSEEAPRYQAMLSIFASKLEGSSIGPGGPSPSAAVVDGVGQQTTPATGSAALLSGNNSNTLLIAALALLGVAVIKN